MLLWAGVELIFSIVGGMGLCFGFALITVSTSVFVIAEEHLHNTKVFSASHTKKVNVLMLTC